MSGKEPRPKMSLSSFSGLSSKQEELPEQSVAATKTVKKAIKAKKKTIQLEITADQHRWLSETATKVRDNNTAPTLPQERTYPQHLVGVAIDLLRAAEVDWSGVEDVQSLRKMLGI